jgi:AraC family transcriptional regulator
MQREPAESGRLLGPFEYHPHIPVEPTAASHRLGWTGLEATRFSDLGDTEFERPALTHHSLILFTKPPDELDLRYEDVKRHRPPPMGSVSVVPAGMPTHWRWRGTKSSLHVYLEPELVGRIAAEAFGLDWARWMLPPLDSLALPQLRDALLAVNAELTAGGAGGPLAAESLANILAVHLIRHIVAPGRAVRGRDGTLPRGRLRAVLEYIEEHLDAAPTLAEIAAVAGLNCYHFARQFKAATGLPPHQYAITRRVERAKHLLREGTDSSLAEVAAQAGFYDQSQFSRHFKRLVGVTPSQFRTPSRIA